VRRTIQFNTYQAQELLESQIFKLIINSIFSYNFRRDNIIFHVPDFISNTGNINLKGIISIESENRSAKKKRETSVSMKQDEAYFFKALQPSTKYSKELALL